MSFKKAIVSTAAAAALTTSAFAGMGATTVAADKTGDYLLFPAYYANDAGWKTDLRVVNTNTSASVIAKVVIRDGKQSDEKVDFMIYLTPGDVWEGLIYEDGGSVYINSTDDSMVIGNVLGSEIDGGITLTFPAAVNGQVITSGYVEVFGVATNTGDGTFDLDADTSYTDDLTAAPVDKHALYTAFAKDYDDADNSWDYVGNDDLTGQAVIYADNENGALAMTYPATAMEGVTEDMYPVDQTDVDTNFLGVDTKLATMTTDPVCTAITDMEAALNKTSTYVIHYGDESIDESALLATFVTKKYRLDEGGAVCPIWDIFVAKDADEEEYGYAQSSDFYVEYSGYPRDMEEHTPAVPEGTEVSGGTTEEIEPETCDRELCRVTVVNSIGPEGYVTYSFIGSDNNDTETDPVSPMPYDHRVMTAKNVGGTNVTNIINPAYK